MKTTYVRRKFLLGVFKLRRAANRWLGIRRLDYDKKDLYILTDTIREYETRARSVAKEPKTVAWIERHGGEGSVLYDVGANIGAYSLIAAARGASVVAFEPAHQNLYKLHENVLLNKLTKKITVVPLMLAAKNAVARSFIEDRDRGFGASHTFTAHVQPSDTPGSHAFLAMRLDDCMKIFSLPVPTMLKIDVDGAEAEILAGAPNLLANPKPKTILIEVEEKDRASMLRTLTDRGFRLVDEEKSGTLTVNYIFERN